MYRGSRSYIQLSAETCNCVFGFGHKQKRSKYVNLFVFLRDVRGLLDRIYRPCKSIVKNPDYRGVFLLNVNLSFHVTGITIYSCSMSLNIFVGYDVVCRLRFLKAVDAPTSKKQG